MTDPRSPVRPSYSRVADVRTTPAATLLALLATAILALALTGRAAAAPPCAEAILADWLDNNRIDRLYDLPCYEAAVDAIPLDIRPYSDVEDVIRRAFQAAAHRRLAMTTAPRAEGGTTPRRVPPVVTSSPSAIPIPLLVLGGMSVVLLTAGGLGYVSRRRRAETLEDPTSTDGSGQRD